LWDPIIEGCTTSTACNYNPEAKEDDNSCINPLGCDNWCPDDTTEVKELDCAGVCDGIQFIDCTGQCGILVIDECGVCGGNNTICRDCNGVVNGEAELDNCLECVLEGDTSCIQGCDGIWDIITTSTYSIITPAYVTFIKYKLSPIIYPNTITALNARGISFKNTLKAII
jgi:hypothetical protein